MHHLGILLVHLCIVVGKITGIGGFIHFFLVALHASQIIDIVRVGKCRTVVGVGKFSKY